MILHMISFSWGAAVLIFSFVFIYPFLIYPALTLVLSRLRRKTQRAASPSRELPSAALVICALNEGKIIREKIQNSLNLRYPEGKLKIIVISDGSTDDTAAIAREYENQGLILVERSTRRGKIANLNDVLPQRTEEILVLSDANVIYHPDAVWRLVARFDDPSVGCVSGKVVLSDNAPVLDGPTKDYYSLEWHLQEAGSAIYSMAGADGAMYALRRELFRPCPTDTLIEDFVIPMQVVRQGRRVVFEPAALGWEQGPSSLGEEFRRKTRISAGAAQALLRGNGWPVGAPARFWFVFVSHKLLRWISPLLALTVVSLALASPQELISKLALAAVGGLCILAFARVLTGSRHPVLSGAMFFVFGQCALAYGLLKGAVGLQPVLWAKVDR